MSGESNSAGLIVKVYRHKERGTAYRIIGEAVCLFKASDEAPALLRRNVDGQLVLASISDKHSAGNLCLVRIQGPIEKGVPVVVYQGIDGEIGEDMWGRGHGEFHDGRFEEVALRPPQSSAAQAATVADGWRLVPEKPTDAMLRAGGHANSEWLNDNAPLGERRYAMPMPSVYSAMLAAAPAALTGPEPRAPAGGAGIEATVARLMREAWPDFGGNHNSADFWNGVGDGVRYAVEALNQPQAKTGTGGNAPHA